MNAYAKEDPITVFRDAGYVDTIDEFLEGHGYSYVFEGQSGYLDHALASADLAGQVTGVTEWHINADEPIALDYNLEFKSAGQQVTYYADDAYRSSDHDPVLVGLDLNAPPTVDAGGPYAVVEGESVTVTADGSDPDDDSLTYEWDLDNNGTFETDGPERDVLGGRSDGAEQLDDQGAGHRPERTQLDGRGRGQRDLGLLRLLPADRQPPDAERRQGRQRRAGQVQPGRQPGAGHPGRRLADVDPGQLHDLGADGPAQEITIGEALSYRSDNDTYSLTWKTTKGWTGCRLLTVELDDGTVHEAAFRFTK